MAEVYNNISNIQLNSQELFPVHNACREGDVQTLTQFVSLRNNRSLLVTEDNLYHWTPIHWASFFGQLPALIVLREAGVGVDTTTARFKQTAAHVAAFAGASHCLKYLVHFGCNANAQDYLGETPLHKVARSGTSECGRVLAEARALATVPNTSGQTPAQLAAACGHWETARHLEAYQQSQSGCNGGVPPVPTAAVAIPPGLNGGHLPARAVVAVGPWCYQPPPARPLATADAVGGAAPRHSAEVEMDDAPTAQKRGLDTEARRRLSRGDLWDTSPSRTRVTWPRYSCPRRDPSTRRVQNMDTPCPACCRPATLRHREDKKSVGAGPILAESVRYSDSVFIALAEGWCSCRQKTVIKSMEW